jgi:membrane dipeptidase
MTASRRDVIRSLGAAGLAALVGGSAWSQAGEWFDPAASPLGMTITPEQLDAGKRFLRRHASVDVHCHPGRFFLRDVEHPSPRIEAYGAPFEDKAIAEMEAGQLSAALFAGVSDMSLLEFKPDKGLFATREFEPGEAWADYRRQIGVLKGLVSRGAVLKGRSVRDVARAHRKHQTACVFSIEGGDFIEDRLERIHEAHADGVRAITIVHYHINQIGDIQTAPAHHGGLTPTGAAIVREMNKAGIIIDLAHAPLSVVRGAVDVASRPMMISHTNLVSPTFDHPRLVTREHARLVTTHGGIIGSVPSGIGQTNFAQWIDSIFRLVDEVGIDHVAIGSDMDANYMPVFTTYRAWHLLPAALLARGLSEREAAKIMGGNFLRVMRANAA